MEKIEKIFISKFHMSTTSYVYFYSCFTTSKNAILFGNRYSKLGTYYIHHPTSFSKYGFQDMSISSK